ncbi:wall-associated receptor kinase 5-like [Triticum dicoccoides]|uniref:wall-associated receptor kinase 5-like n=1 Tax=Triticum dicoccoides TaxID=85692 RepID=UPI001891A74D|nr:wall-associated receptor kinase 5-like [Triticum dicoccoides]
MLTGCVSIAAAALVLLISANAVTAGDPPLMIGLPGCDTSCGNVSVPYPFGMGPSRCYRPGFKLTCDNDGSKPPRLLLGDGSAGTFEVDRISLDSSWMRVVSHGLQAINMSGGSGRWSLGETADGVLYSLHPRSNEFMLTGCNVQAMLMRKGNLVSGCASSCPPRSDRRFPGYVQGHGPNSTCSNIGCCQSSIVGKSMPYGASYDVYLNRLKGIQPNDTKRYTTVKNVLLIAKVGWLEEHNLKVVMEFTYKNNSSHWRRKADQLRVPVVLQWAVAHDVPVYNSSRKCPRDVRRSICKSTNSKCKDAKYCKDRGAYSCQCKKGYQGNPYLTSGCQGNELPGSFGCRCPAGTHGNSTLPGGCVQPAGKIKGNLGLIIGLSVASGPCILLLVLGALLITRALKQRKADALRRKFFSQNRGQLLEQLVSHRADIAERMLISLEELVKATNNFDQTRRLGGGGHGTVYKGILSDLHVVAIKKSNIVVKREIDEFINEVAILSQINHRNIVRLRGCCLETEVPLLAYEFISNGTLSDHLHTEEPGSLPWKDRLRITSEISKALAYLHSSVSVPIIHRDIKPSNILLDDALTAKVSDFGASRYIQVDQAGTTTAVQGTIGYLDPMYYYNGRLTESSDVYSFGVLLVELLTRRKPSLYRSTEGDGLVMQFVALLAEGNLPEILDPQVVEEGGSEVKEVATLAVACVKLRAEERPTMRQVEMALEALQATKELVWADLVEEIDEVYVATSYPSTSQQAKKKRKEASRCYSQEEEFMLSATFPR